MSNSPEPTKPPKREFESATQMRKALADLADQAQTGTPIGKLAWSNYWLERDKNRLSTWQAYMLGLRYAAEYQPPPADDPTPRQTPDPPRMNGRTAIAPGNVSDPIHRPDRLIPPIV